ncbi:MAG: GNAT family N-acetyltransferase [Acidimicrobiia bacterium]|nr:GNAT family N-acetyltransferase [Acidimicrobiia bacterium]
MAPTNALGQPVGEPVPNWTARAFPEPEPMAGRTCRLEPLDVASHAADLAASFAADIEGRTWTYLPYGPWDSAEAHQAWLGQMAASRDPQFYAIVDAASGKAVGQASYLRMVPEHGVIEVGHLAFSPALQQTTAATEAMYLMMLRAFDGYGYRRYEWKCDSHNAPSLRAARRLGFVDEGVFRQAVVMKQRNRDSAWLSITDAEWPRVRAALEAWLAPSNFDDAGQQLASLPQLREEIVGSPVGGALPSA